MILKKFENGEIEMCLEASDYEYYKDDENVINIDALYGNEMNMSDLYFNQINGYMYLVDFNQNNVYDFSDCHMDILQYLRSELLKNKPIYLYPVDKQRAGDLIQDLENGY